LDIADRSYEHAAPPETRLATVFATWLHEYLAPATVASPDATARILWEDRAMPRTVLIVDDHEAFRESATALLEAEGFDVVGEAADGPQAVTEVERLQPEVVLLDIQLPDLDGFAVAERLAALPQAPRVVLISSREASAYGHRLGEAAASGFITKRELSGRALAALVG
jgi:CheY-like chemotaxis protein